METKKIEYLGYLFRDLQPKTAPYHLLLKYLTDYPPEGYEFVERPIDKNHAQIRDEKFPNFHDAWRNRCRDLKVEEYFQQIVDNTVPYPTYLVKLMQQREVPCNVPCFISPFPVPIANPWMIEIEDWVTLFHWWFHNGETHGIDLKSHPGVRVMQALLELPNFKCVVTHIKQTIQSLTAIFGNHLTDKFIYIPMARPTPKPEYIVSPNKPTKGKVNFIFHGSFNHTAIHFFLRGGYAFLEAFLRCEHKYDDIQFTIIYDESAMSSLQPHYQDKIRNHPKIKWIRKYLTEEEFNKEMAQADVFVLPAYRTHSMSLTQALSHGLPVLTSNGWGIDEFITNLHDGIVSHFEPQVNSWVDVDGIFRENYLPLTHLYESFVGSLMTNIGIIMEDRALLSQMSRNAFDTFQSRLTIYDRNKKLKTLFNERFTE